MSKKSGPAFAVTFDTLSTEAEARAVASALGWMRQAYAIGPIKAAIVRDFGKLRDEDVERIIGEAGERYRALPPAHRSLARPLSAEEKAAKAEADRQKLVARSEWMDEAVSWIFHRLIQLPPDPHLEDAVHSLTDEMFALWKERIGIDGIRAAYAMAAQRRDKRLVDEEYAEAFERARSIAVQRWQVDARYSGKHIVAEIRIAFPGIGDKSIELALEAARNVARGRGTIVEDEAVAEGFAALRKVTEPVPAIRDEVLIHPAMLQ